MAFTLKSSKKESLSIWGKRLDRYQVAYRIKSVVIVKGFMLSLLMLKNNTGKGEFIYAKRD